MSPNLVIFVSLVIVELTIIIMSVIIYTLFKILDSDMKNIRSDYNFRQAKLEEIVEGKNEINQLITGQYKLILEQYEAILAYWKVSGEYIKDLSEQYSVLEERYSDLYEQYDQINHRIEDIANAVKPEEIDLDEASSIYWDPFYDRAEIDFAEEEEKTDES